ncbi:unnamed protein product [Effrenium voratum]|nr:unnamed protein product [Effrenium voratum]
MASWRWIICALQCHAARIGIVTMHSPNIMSYANATEVANRRYAERHAYGFHILDHPIDTSRVPHWAKLHAVLIHLADYDYVFWIDADAMFYDYLRRLEDVLEIRSGDEIWIQEHGSDFPSLLRKEFLDGSCILFKNSAWTRQFILELYYYPPCQSALNWTEQYCLCMAYEDDLLGMRGRTKILPAGRLNHHRIPAPGEKEGLFIFHLSGQTAEHRSLHFNQILEGRARDFQEEERYQSFWSFQQLFQAHNFGELASLHLCVLGIGDRHQAMLDAMLFHFTYLTGCIIVFEGAAGLWSQIHTSDATVGRRFTSRMAILSIEEYLRGTTRDGEQMVKSYYCDLLVLGVESFRHLPRGLGSLAPLVLAGLEHADGGFGFSPLHDAFLVLLEEGCERKEGLLVAQPGLRLDKDDQDGKALAGACSFLSGVYGWADDIQSRAGVKEEDPVLEVVHEGNLGPVPWAVSAPHLWGFHQQGKVTLMRAPRRAFL